VNCPAGDIAVDILLGTPAVRVCGTHECRMTSGVNEFDIRFKDYEHSYAEGTERRSGG
jgi:hypothetical protein